MKHVIPAVAIAFAGLLLFGLGCASKPSIKQGFDFSRFHTFAILPMKARGTYQDPTIVARMSQSVQEAVADTLVAKGFRLVPEGEADFLVELEFDYFEDQGRYEDRTFELNIIDRRSQAVVWSDFLHRKTDTALPVSVVRQAVANMLKPFPPGSQPAPN